MTWLKKKFSTKRERVTYILLALTAAAFCSMPMWVHTMTPHGQPPQLAVPMSWFRALGTLALLSTIVWSIMGLTTLFDDINLQNAKTLGTSIFIVTFLLVCAAMAACILGIGALFNGAMYWHLVCVFLAEGTFLLFDLVLLRRLRQLWNAGTIVAKEGEWSATLGRQLHAWFCYIDRPATIAFILLIIAVRYLDGRVFYSDFEREMFASGAVSFALMTANLAFFAANLPEFVPGKTPCHPKDEASIDTAETKAA